MQDEITKRLELAIDAAREAGKLTLEYFRRDDLVVDLKHDATPVTIADLGAEKLLRERIAVAFPQDGILGEELGEKPGTSGYRWILDPIDGTKSFIHGVPLYAVLIGVERAAGGGPQAASGQSETGVIHLPALNETVYAAKEQGAWHLLGDRPKVPARVSKTKSLGGALFLTSGLAGFHRRGAWPSFERLTKTAKLTRTWGDAYGYSLVATGRAEVMVDPEMNLWDAAAILPIIEEAGGKFTDWRGNPTIARGEGIATNGLVHEEVLKLVRS
jgi:histidinol phosphatase-like enzyme (inositol monophosphatase family)